MNRTRWRLLVACLAVIGAAIAVAGGSAGNREGLVTFEALPGPGAVSYGENIAYRSTFDNTNTTARSSRRSGSSRRGRKRTIGTTTVMAANVVKTSCAATAWSIDTKNDTDPDERRVRVQRPAAAAAGGRTREGRRCLEHPGGHRLPRRVSVLPQVRGQVADQGAEVDQRERDVPASPGRGLGVSCSRATDRTRRSGPAGTSWGRAVATARASARTRP